ncbi:hypothetical protein AA313_de0204656 [Arthrobotrys entomopaga]|nr:hypothetical protein AA313_de0204656 [Arthrobotrys entomopaga]
MITWPAGPVCQVLRYFLSGMQCENVNGSCLEFSATCVTYHVDEDVLRGRLAHVAMHDPLSCHAHAKFPRENHHTDIPFENCHPVDFFRIRSNEKPMQHAHSKS